jgi:DNA-binding transcriptional ArsR family regulator
VAQKTAPATKTPPRKPASKAPVCASAIVHEDRVEAAKAAAPDPERLAELGDLFKVFADPSRLRVLSALGSGELCVCDLVAALGMSQSAVSHQLAVLRGARLVRYRREGKMVLYSLGDLHIGAMLAVGLDHVSERGRP